MIKQNQLTRPTQEQSERLRFILYSMIRSNDGELAYALFMQKMNIHALVPSEDQQAPIFNCWLGTDGYFNVAVNFERFGKLSKAAAKEVIKHCVLHIPHGHLSSRGKKLRKRYGAEISDLAEDMVVNQHVGVDILAAEDVVIPVPELFKLPRNKYTEFYAEQLEKQKQEDPQGYANAKARLKGNGIDSHNHNDDDSEVGDGDLDMANKQMINGVDQTLKASNDSLKNRGFYPGECEEFIKSLERESKIGWMTMLRRKVGHHKKIKRKPTKVRPSRRFFSYFGRLRKQGVSCLVCIDTSGSMGTVELSCVESELKNMIRNGAAVFVTNIDTQLAKGPFEFKRGMSLNTFGGRGGTCFTPGIELYKNMQPRPDFMVYITDGYGEQVPYNPELDILWLLTDTGMNIDQFVSQICNGWPKVDCVILDTKAD